MFSRRTNRTHRSRPRGEGGGVTERGASPAHRPIRRKRGYILLTDQSYAPLAPTRRRRAPVTTGFRSSGRREIRNVTQGRMRARRVERDGETQCNETASARACVPDRFRVSRAVAPDRLPTTVCLARKGLQSRPRVFCGLHRNSTDCVGKGLWGVECTLARYWHRRTHKTK
eukprot:8729784-Pyramimonas_sp.AAC.1